MWTGIVPGEWIRVAGQLHKAEEVRLINKQPHRQKCPAKPHSISSKKQQGTGENLKKKSRFLGFLDSICYCLYDFNFATRRVNLSQSL
jgi:hypothetical protein